MKANKKVNLILSLIVFVVGIIWAILKYLACDGRLDYCGLFLLYTLVYIAIPGYILYGLLFAEKRNWSFVWLLSWILGLGLLIGEYVIESLLPFNGFITVANPILIISFIIYCIKTGEKPNYFKQDDGIKVVQALLIMVVFAASLAHGYYLIYSEYAQNVYAHPDYLWHSGNIAVLSRSILNIPDVHLHGIKFYYHYFFDIIFAVCKHIFGMPGYGLFMNTRPILTAITFTPGVFVIVDRLFANARFKNQLIYGLYAVLPFCALVVIEPILYSGPELNQVCLLLDSIFTNSNAVGTSIGTGVILVELIYAAWDDERFNYKKAIALAIVISICAGIKATTAVEILAAIVACYIVQSLIEKKYVATRLLYLFSMALSFGFTYVLVLADVVNGSHSNRMLTMFSTNQFVWTRVGNIMAYRFAVDYSHGFWYLVAAAIYATLLAGPTVALWGIYFIKRIVDIIKTKTVGDMFDWMAFACVCVGLGGASMTFAQGFSNNYFFNAVYIFMAYAVIRLLQTRKKLVWPLIAGYLVICCLGMKYLPVPKFAPAEVIDGIQQEAHSPDNYEAISADVLAAYKWIQENSPEDSLCAQDKYWICENGTATDYLQARFFYPSAFTEREIFVEGFIYSNIDAVADSESYRDQNELFFSEDVDVAAENLKNEGIDYLIVTTEIHPGYVPSPEYATMVYGNNEIQVYEISF